jgi:NAD(P)H-hydrate epimerase
VSTRRRGETPGVAVDADVVLTLALPKTGLGAAAAEWELRLVDIGIPAEVYRRADVGYDRPFSGDVRVRLRPDSPDAGGKSVYKRGESC